MISEPGGYIQWDELDCATFHAHAPNASISTQSSSELLARWGAFSAKSGLDFTFVSLANPLLRFEVLSAQMLIRV